MASVMTGITAVCYSGAFVHAVLGRRTDLVDMDAEKRLTRDMLIRTARQEGSLMTLHQQPNGRWVRWDTITLVTINGTDYLKCTDDGCACDDLGDLSAGDLG